MKATIRINGKEIAEVSDLECTFDIEGPPLRRLALVSFVDDFQGRPGIVLDTVRCDRCKHWVRTGDGDMSCSLLVRGGGELHPFMPTPPDFGCSRFERKEA